MAPAVLVESRANPSGKSIVDSTGEARASLTPELVIALCGPIGSPLHATASQIRNALAEYNYITEVVRLSDRIRENARLVSVDIDDASKLNDAKGLIAAGNAIRAQFGNDVLAKLSIAKIRADRQKRFGEFKDKVSETDAENKISNQRICHVIDSVKNKAELDLLRLVYGQALYAIGVFSPLEIRRRNLEQPGELTADQVNQLIDTDSGEEIDHGQSVRDTFPSCDFFLRVDHAIVPASEAEAAGQIVQKLARFFSLVFRTSVTTPTAEETAMYAAASAARNSACISRQVGAAVTSSNGEVLAVGWNDVPRYGGGLYGKPALNPSVGLVLEERCFAQQGSKCHNDFEKTEVARLLVESLSREGLLKEQDRTKAQDVIQKSRVRDLIEFSRAVHAEMHAILGAGRVAGDRIVGGKLFVTTYPCHSCARHIVASGISEVYFIEPYRKSLATRLHKDSLTESVQSQDKVRLLQFDGVAPRRFLDMFEAGDRKIGGVLSLGPKPDARPANQVSLKAIPRMEQVVVAELSGGPLQLPDLIEVPHHVQEAAAAPPRPVKRGPDGPEAA